MRSEPLETRPAHSDYRGAIHCYSSPGMDSRKEIMGMGSWMGLVLHALVTSATANFSKVRKQVETSIAALFFHAAQRRPAGEESAVWPRGWVLTDAMIPANRSCSASRWPDRADAALSSEVIATVSCNDGTM